MPAIGAQFDSLAGLDLSSLLTASLSQVMQAINQIAPLSNIGGLVVFDGGGGTSWPGVVANPRFKRYIWLDLNGGSSPTIKVYDQSGTDGYANWTSQTIANLSITDAKVSASAAIAITKLASGTARYIVRTNAAGTALEFINPNAIFTNDDVPLIAINRTTAIAGQFLRYVNNSLQFVTYNPTPDITGLALSQLPTDSPNKLFQVQASGIPGWVSNDDSISNFLAAGGPAAGIRLSKLKADGSSYQVPQVVGGLVQWTTPAVVVSVIADHTPGAPYAVNTFYTIDTSAIGFAHPKSIQLTAVCTSTNNGYLVGDEIKAECIFGSANSFNPITYFYDSVDAKVKFYIRSPDGTADINVRTVPKGGGGYATIDIGTTPKWKFRARVIV